MTNLLLTIPIVGDIAAKRRPSITWSSARSIRKVRRNIRSRQQPIAVLRSRNRCVRNGILRRMAVCQYSDQVGSKPRRPVNDRTGFIVLFYR
jgi:hypothetical protein